LLLITLIGGRLIPSFTRNWLARMNPGALSAPTDRWDVAAIVLAAGALAAWVAASDAPLTGWALLAAGLAHTARLARWCGWRAWRDRPGAGSPRRLSVRAVAAGQSPRVGARV
jgi:uncharacterized protein involved in response to NO